MDQQLCLTCVMSHTLRPFTQIIPNQTAYPTVAAAQRPAGHYSLDVSSSSQAAAHSSSIRKDGHSSYLASFCFLLTQ